MVISNELKHYGIKGMRWGVRRKKEQLDRISKRAYTTEETPDKFIIKKGSKLHRVTSTPTLEKKGFAYVSFTDEDVMGYRKEITKWYNLDTDIQTYDMTFKVKEDLILPKTKAQVEAFIDLYKNEKISDTNIAYLYANNSSKDKLIGKPARLQKKLVDEGLPENLATRYALFSMSLYQNPTNRNILFEELRKRGYNAVEDVEDSFSHRTKPIIVFDREKTLQIQTIKPLPIPGKDYEEWEKLVKESEQAQIKRGG